MRSFCAIISEMISQICLFCQKKVFKSEMENKNWRHLMLEENMILVTAFSGHHMISVHTFAPRCLSSKFAGKSVDSSRVNK